MKPDTILIHTVRTPGQRRREGYARYLLHPRWRERRQTILHRDAHRCRHCGSDGPLEVHHRQYRLDRRTRRLVPPWDYEDACLITLCRPCHQAGHDRYRVPCFNISDHP